MGKRSSWIESAPSYAAAFGIIFGAITAMLGVASYREQVASSRDQADKELAARVFEAQKPFFEKQTEFYVEAMETVSKIATSASPAKDDLDHFWALYWGRLAAVEDTNVDHAMVVFGNKLKSGAPQMCLQQSSLLLAHCVKQSWADTWKVQLSLPPEVPCGDQSFNGVEACN
jgi:hypothetical protein